MSGSKKALMSLGILVALLAAIQLVPYGRDHTNPPAGQPPQWSSARTQDLAKRACFDCHSNETRWPWYASIAPMSWRIQTHVTEGREHLNFTAFAPGNEDVAEAAGEAGETVAKGEMPPQDYLLMHPEARLSAEEKRALAAGLDSTFAAFVEGGEEGGQRAAREKERGEREEEERDDD